MWEMLQSTYASIGVKLGSPRELLDYPVWDLTFSEDVPVAFGVWSVTPYGLKAGLSGSDGSSVGKHIVVADLRDMFHRPGYYGEVSHKVEQIVLASGAPVVCNKEVPEILNKVIVPLEDGAHYTRNLSGVGQVTKVMVGNPKSVPTTKSTETCRLDPKTGSNKISALEMMEHLGCDLDCFSVEEDED